MAKGGIEGSSGALEDVGIEACVDVRLLVVEVELATVRLLYREVVGQDLGLETSGEVVLELKLGVEGVGGCPRLRQGESWRLMVSWSSMDHHCLQLYLPTSLMCKAKFFLHCAGAQQDLIGGELTRSLIGVFSFELSTSTVNIYPRVGSANCGAHRARDGAIMCGFSLDVEAKPASDIKCRRELSSLHHAVGCFGLDFEVGSSGVIEVLV